MSSGFNKTSEEDLRKWEEDLLKGELGIEVQDQLDFGESEEPKDGKLDSD
jgi:hypothetical protein